MTPNKIPLSFKLFGKTIEVEKVNNLSSREGVAGAGRLRGHTLEVQGNCEGYEIAEKEVFINFLHEIFHYILCDLEFKGEDGGFLYRNEQFCNLLALCWDQILTSVKYDDSMEEVNE